MNKQKMIKRLDYHIMPPVSYAKKIGVHIGEGVQITGKQEWTSEPYLIFIGNRTTVSKDVQFLTHDGSTRVFRHLDKYRKVLRFGSIHVGENCFLGAKSIIMPGITIGDNSIIAAGAVVTKDVPPNEIWGGGYRQKRLILLKYLQKSVYLKRQSITKKYTKNIEKKK